MSGPKIKTCRPAEIGCGDFGCSPWAQSLLAVKGWSKAGSKERSRHSEAESKKIFRALRNPENFFAALDGQLLLCHRPGMAGAPYSPVPAARLSNKPFVPPQRIKKRPGQAGTPPEFKLLLYWCGEVRVGYALRRGILKPPLARGAGGLGKLASLALLARWPAGFAGALPPITAAPPSAARQHQTLSPVPPSSAALSPAARAVTHPASCSSSSRTNLVLHCCGR